MDDQSTIIFRAMERDIVEALDNCTTGRELEVLHGILRPDPHLLWYKCMEVKKDLVNALSQYYPSVRLEVFGSTVMGTAFKDSDFDFYIELSPTPLNITSARIIRDALQILARSGKFTKFTPITRARVPILKCYHVRTEYSCDINFSDSYGILNSPIMAHLLTFDARIYLLVTIIKYWMKIHNCVGPGKISNYAVLWLIIFYLQSIPNPIVPPIIEFQRNVRPYLVNGYNFAFDYSLPNLTRNRQRFSELLLGFFEFYTSFDFTNNIICPLYGRSFPKQNLFDNHPREFARYIEISRMNPNAKQLQLNKCMCIQDPFEISHSIPGVIPERLFAKFRAKILYAGQIIQKFLSESGESSRLLLSLMNEDQFETFSNREDVVNRRDDNGSKGTDGRLTYRLRVTDSDLLSIRSILKNQEKIDTVLENLSVHQFWAENVVKFLCEILQDIFCLTVEVKNIANSTKQVANGSSNKVNNHTSSKSIDITKYQKELEINGICDVFYSRKQTKITSPAILQREISESKRRLERKLLPISLKAVVRIYTDLEKFDSISVEFEDLIKRRKNNYFKTFFTTIVQHTRQYIKGYLLAMKQNNEPNATVISNTLNEKQTSAENEEALLKALEKKMDEDPIEKQEEHQEIPMKVEIESTEESKIKPMEEEKADSDTVNNE